MIDALNRERSDSLPSSVQRITYKVPSKKTPVNPILRSIESLSFQTSGIGRHMMPKSITMFGTFVAINHVLRLKHWLRGTEISHAPLTGLHWKMVVSNTAIPQATTATMKHLTRTANFLLTPKMRRYKHRTDDLMQVTIEA